MATLPTVLVTANGSGPRNWQTQQFGQIDEGISSADGLEITAPTSTNNVDTSFDIATTPSNFNNMDTLSWQVRYRCNTNRVDDILGLQMRIVSRTSGTILAAGDSGGTFQSVSSSVTNSSHQNSSVVAFTYVNTTATKAQWDDAEVELRQTFNQVMSADSTLVAVDTLQFSGTYTIASTPVSITSPQLTATAAALAPTVTAVFPINITAPTATVSALIKPPVLPADFSNVYTRPVSTSSIILDWGANLTGTGFYEIYRDKQGGAPTTLLTTVQAPASSFTDTTATIQDGDFTYKYIVKAVNAVGTRTSQLLMGMPVASVSTDSLRDTFSGPTIDPQWIENFGDLNFVDGKLRMLANWDGAGLDSDFGYDFRDQEIFLELAGWYHEQPHVPQLQFYVILSNGYHILLYFRLDVSNNPYWETEAPSGGIQSHTFNAGEKWLRLRSDTTNRTLYADVSVDRQTWRNLRSFSWTINHANIDANSNIGIYVDQNTPNTTDYIEIDNFNTVVASITSPQATASALMIPSILFAPNNVLAAPASNTAIDLTWDAVTGADDYEIQMSTGTSGTYSTIGTSDTISFQATGLTSPQSYPYGFRVRGRADGVGGAYSLPISDSFSMPYTSTLAEDFVDGFTTAINDPPWVWIHAPSSPQISSGRLRITPTGSYDGIASHYSYDIRESEVIVQIVEFPRCDPTDEGAWVETGISIAGAAISIQTQPALDEFDVPYTEIEIRGIVYNIGTQTPSFKNWEGETWFRVRETAGTTYVESSLDAVTWDIIDSSATLEPGELDSIIVIPHNTSLQLWSGKDGTMDTGGPQYALFDNINIVPIDVTSPQATASALAIAPSITLGGGVSGPKIGGTAKQLKIFPGGVAKPMKVLTGTGWITLGT